MASRLRPLARAFHTTTARRAGAPPWGTQVNEPGGRLFGEAILKPGERRKMYDWEPIYVGTNVIAALMLIIGLNSKPETDPKVWAMEEAQARIAARETPQAADEE